MHIRGDTMDTAFKQNPDLESASATDAASPIPEAVSFQNPFFTFCEEIAFERREGEEAPVMVVPMAEQSISMHFPGVIRELNLAETDHDYIMLEAISRSLDFVCMLRVGDPIPSEIRNGKASWQIYDRHITLARHRLMLKLLSWINGTDDIIADPNEIASILDDAENRKKIDKAFVSIAETLGYGKDQKEQVVSLVETLADELSYIEALREIYGEVKTIVPTVNEIIKCSRFDDFTRESANSVKRLLHQALREYEQEFLQLDAQTGEIIAVLKNVNSQIQYIRQMRDDLARRLLAWSDIERKWRKLNIKERNGVEEALIETYRFLALRFLPAMSWKLVSQTLDEHVNKTESVW